MESETMNTAIKLLEVTTDQKERGAVMAMIISLLPEPVHLDGIGYLLAIPEALHARAFASTVREHPDCSDCTHTKDSSVKVEADLTAKARKSHLGKGRIIARQGGVDVRTNAEYFGGVTASKARTSTGSGQGSHGSIGDGVDMLALPLGTLTFGAWPNSKGMRVNRIVQNVARDGGRGMAFRDGQPKSCTNVKGHGQSKSCAVGTKFQDGHTFKSASAAVSLEAQRNPNAVLSIKRPDWADDDYLKARGILNVRQVQDGQNVVTVADPA